MNVNLAQLGERYDAEAMRRRTEQIERAFTRVLSTEEASYFALLVAPNATIWRVSVDNNGQLRTDRIPTGREIPPLPP